MQGRTMKDWTRKELHERKRKDIIGMGNAKIARKEHEGKEVQEIMVAKENAKKGGEEMSGKKASNEAKERQGQETKGTGRTARK